MFKGTLFVFAALGSTVLADSAQAWDHPGHMTTAAIAYEEIKQARPDLIEKIGLLFWRIPTLPPSG